MNWIIIILCLAIIAHREIREHNLKKELDRLDDIIKQHRQDIEELTELIKKEEQSNG